MKNENYINIQGWMVNEMKLKSNELILYALIYGYSQDGRSKCKSSISYIMKGLGVSNRTAINLIDKLLKKKLIIRYENNTGNEYSVNSSLVKKVHTQCEESSQVSSEESSHNNNIYTNTNTNIAKTSFAKKEIDLVIEMFGEVNPSVYTLYGNTTERKCCERLLKKWSIKEIEAVIKILPEINSNRYAKGKSIKPTELERNLGHIKAFIDQKQVNQDNRVVSI